MERFTPIWVLPVRKPTRAENRWIGRKPLRLRSPTLRPGQWSRWTAQLHQLGRHLLFLGVAQSMSRISDMSNFTTCGGTSASSFRRDWPTPKSSKTNWMPMFLSRKAISFILSTSATAVLHLDLSSMFRCDGLYGLQRRMQVFGEHFPGVGVREQPHPGILATAWAAARQEGLAQFRFLAPAWPTAPTGASGPVTGQG